MITDNFLCTGGASANFIDDVTCKGNIPRFFFFIRTQLRDNLQDVDVMYSHVDIENISVQIGLFLCLFILNHSYMNVKYCYYSDSHQFINLCP